MSRVRLGLAARIVGAVAARAAFGGAFGATVAIGSLLGLAGLPARAHAANPAQFAITVSMVPAPVPVVAKLVTPGAPGLGGPLAYRIVVTNAGAGTVNALKVVDTVSPVLVNPVTDQPGGFGVPVVTQVPGTGTRYEWSAGALTMGPNASLTFTITGQAGFVCAPTAVSNTAYVVATGPGGTVGAFSPSAGFILQPPAASLAVSKLQFPASPVAGGPVTYLLVVANTGSATITSLTVTDTVSPVVTLPATQQTAPFAAPTVIGGASASLFAWTAAVAMTPGMTYTFTVSGTVGLVTATTTVGNTVYASGATACATTQASGIGPAFTLGPSVVLQAGLIVSRSVVSTGQSVLVMMTVTNTGAGTATGVSATVWSASTAAPWVGTAATTSAATLAPGASVVFTWTATAASAGAVWWTGTVTANEASASAGVSPAVTIQNAANLVATATASAASVCAGGAWRVVVGVTNAGQAAAGSVTAGIWQSAGAGTASVVGPTPATAGLAGGANTTFTFTVTGLTTGSVTMTATATGVDANSAVTVASVLAATAPVTVNSGAALTAALNLPATVSVGQTFTATVMLDNTAGGSPVTGVSASATTVIGSGTSTVPAPASQAVAAAGTGIVTWGYTAVSAGTHSFSVTVTGLACGSPVSLVVGGTVNAVPAAALSGTLIVTTPTPTTVGSLVVVTLTLTNTGGANANGIAAVVTPVGAVGLLAGPMPAGPVVIAGAGRQTFVWTYTTSGSGALSFNWNAAGTDANSGLPVTANATGGGGMQVLTPAALAVSVTAAPGAVCATQPFLVMTHVTNTGQAAANAVNAGAFVLSGAGGAALSAGPTPALPATIPGGASQTFTWTYTGGAPGNVWLTTTVTATDAVSGAAMSSGPRVSGVVAVNASAVLAAALAVTPATASVGQVVNVTLTVTNTGGVPATGVTGLLEVVAGAGTIGGAPGSPTINPGVSAAYGWTYTVGSAGAHVFSVTATGLTCGSFTVQDVTGATLAAVSPAVLTATLIVTTPAVTVEGQLVVVTLTITNTGTANANAVVPILGAAGVGGALGGPAPAGPVVIAGGGARTFVWTYTTTGFGGLSFNASAAGTDANSGFAVGTGVMTSAGVAVQSPANLVVTALDVIAGIRVGEVLSATVTVQNTGQAGANGVTLVRVLGDPNGALGAPAPAMPAPFTLAGGASSSFAWFYPSSTCGPLTVSLTVTGIEALTGLPLFGSAMVPSAVAGVASFVVMNAAPTRGRVGTFSSISVTVYDSCTPAQRVPGVAVSLAVILGKGTVISPAGTTTANGNFGSRFRIASEAGMNGIRADVAGTSGGTVFIEGVTPSETVDFLTKNFFDPKRGEKVQVRVFVPAYVHLSVRVYNLAAEMVRVVREADVQPGLTAWEWDGRNDLGQFVGNGNYFIQIVAGKDVQIKRVIVLKR